MNHLANLMFNLNIYTKWKNKSNSMKDKRKEMSATSGSTLVVFVSFDSSERIWRRESHSGGGAAKLQSDRHGGGC